MIYRFFTRVVQSAIEDCVTGGEHLYCGATPGACVGRALRFYVEKALRSNPKVRTGIEPRSTCQRPHSMPIDQSRSRCYRPRIKCRSKLPVIVEHATFSFTNSATDAYLLHNVLFQHLLPVSVAVSVLWICYFYSHPI